MAALKELLSAGVEEIRARTEKVLDGVRFDQSEVDRQLDEALTSAEGWLKTHAPMAFAEAQYQLFADVFMLLVRDSQLRLVSPEETATWDLMDAKSKSHWRNDLTRRLQQRKNQRIEVKHGGTRSRKADLRELRKRYCEVLDDWKEAAQIYTAAVESRSSTRRGSWQAEVQRAFPTLPSGLIERLQPLAKWPKEAAAHCAEKGGTDAPEDIALEHAARLCGASKYSYKLSTLRKKCQEQGRGISS